MNPKEFFVRHIRGWFPEEQKMPKNLMYIFRGRFNMSMLMPDIGKFSSNVILGIGITYASMVFLQILATFFPFNGVIGLIAWLGSLIAFAFPYFYTNRRQFKFDSLMALKIVLGILIAPFSFYLIYMCELTGLGSFLIVAPTGPGSLLILFVASVFAAIGFVGIYGDRKLLKFCSGVFFIGFLTFIVFRSASSIPFSLRSLFAVSGFLAVGLVGICGDRKYRKLSLCFMALSLLFLVCVPIVNAWQIRRGYGTEWSPFFYSAIYSAYTIPLITVSFAFFVLGSMLILYKRSKTIRNHDLGDITAIAQGNQKLDPTSDNLRADDLKKINTNAKSLGFSVMVLSQLSLIWAAITYTQPEPLSGEVLRYLLMASPFFVVTVVLFTLGFALILYRKSNRLGFLVVTSGSAVLSASIFTQFYRTTVTELMFGYLPLTSHINPYTEFTQPLILASIPLIIIGYVLMLKKRSETGILEA